MEHGATAERDVRVLFMTNKPFGITYVERSSGENNKKVLA